MTHDRYSDTLKPTQIVEIISVVDTREYEEIGEKMMPVRGSGIERQCDRCGRLHEVHAEVRLENGNTAVVGVGCMKTDSMDIQKEGKRKVSRAKRLAKLESELTCLQKRLSEKKEIITKIAQYAIPEIVEEKKVVIEGEFGHTEYHIVLSDGYRQKRFQPIDNDDRVTIKRMWLENKQRESGLTHAHKYVERDIEVVEYKIEKLRNNS